MALQQSDYIALVSAGIAALSAIYARWAVNEAKKANEISLHFYKVEIYEEVVSFSDCFTGVFTVPSISRLAQFQKKAVQRAELYLPTELYVELKSIYEHCYENEVWLGVVNGEHYNAETGPNELEVRSKYKSILNKLYPLIEKIKLEAKLNNA